jgi:hypothetical protein
MATDHYFIRFKGRVLGPLTKDKAVEMVKRGQVTRQHELSPDGTSWRNASEFTELFPQQKEVTAKVVETRSSVEEKTTPSEWYVHVDGANQGPIDENVLKKLIAAGKVTGSSMVWKTGMADWLEAQLVRPEWFAGDRGRRETRVGVEGPQTPLDSSDMGELAAEVLKSQAWILFIAVLGTVVSSFAVIFGFIVFLMVASSSGGGPKKSTEVVLGLIQIASWGVLLYICTLLLKVHSRIQAIRYQPNASSFHEFFQATNRFWAAFGMYCLAVLVVAIVLALFIVILGTSVVGAFRE